MVESWRMLERGAPFAKKLEARMEVQSTACIETAQRMHSEHNATLLAVQPESTMLCQLFWSGPENHRKARKAYTPARTQ
jgi:hypothetical protein